MMHNNRFTGTGADAPPVSPIFMCVLEGNYVFNSYQKTKAGNACTSGTGMGEGARTRTRQS